VPLSSSQTSFQVEKRRKRMSWAISYRHLLHSNTTKDEDNKNGLHRLLLLSI
jgi:hypothetical protein